MWLGLAVLGLGLVAQVWLTIVQVRSERMLAEDPDRIERARAAMHPLHEAVVAAIPVHYELLRERLGAEAVD